MSSSSPPPSNTAAREQASDSPTPRSTVVAPSRGRKFRIKLAAFMRWIHIYLSLFGLAIVLFFSATGITLNHPGWFFGETERTIQIESDLNAKWLNLDVPEIGPEVEQDESRRVAKLEVVEHLRKVHGIRGALTELKVDEAECTVTFKGPGYAADVFIDRQSGHYQLSESYHGLIAILNDLHKGRDTGMVWSVVIDLSAILLIVVSMSGLILLFYIKRRRLPGLVTGLVGAAIVLVVYWVAIS
ncbi:PepSY-associated TM helix domain-containing protein [Singulisphaera sp. Ch08]|uniref:PepSY-associated TM helix domain-containing protein n=1 Tax=Singulisphaera sp. Ch08 TaxID=3120278 RepID=A0AAU7CEW0_9BACT